MDRIPHHLVTAIKSVSATPKVCSKQAFQPIAMKNHAGWLQDKSKVDVPPQNSTWQPVEFMVRLSQADSTNHEFKLIGALCEAPILRYESKGPDHLNRNEDLPLHERRISTPHYHTYDDDGYPTVGWLLSILSMQNGIFYSLNLG